MKKTKLIALLFLTGVLSVGRAAAHDHAPGSGTAEAPAAAKELKTKKDTRQAKQVKAALQKYNCLLCHKYKDKGGTAGPALDEHLKHHPKEELKKLLKEPKKSMPPFPGTDKELDGFLTAITPAAAAGSGADGKPAAKRVLKTYVCPMGEYESDKPGKCPKCGMTMVEKK